MKILIKGAGDLATGIAARLHACGYKIVMTEIAVPLTVRRSVAFSRAVYEEEAQVEDAWAVLVQDMEGAGAVLEEGRIAVIVDETARHSGIVSAGSGDRCGDGKAKHRNLHHGCAFGHRNRPGIYRRRGLPLCH